MKGYHLKTKINYYYYYYFKSWKIFLLNFENNIFNYSSDSLTKRCRKWRVLFSKAHVPAYINVSKSDFSFET